jgi:hypothetical protein
MDWINCTIAIFYGNGHSAEINEEGFLNEKRPTILV